MDLDRIPAADASELENWTPPELGSEQIVYIASEEGTNTARFPSLSANQPDEPSTAQDYPNRRRVTVDELDSLLAQAREQAYAEGLAQGRADGEQQGREEALKLGAEQASQQLETAIASIHALEEQLPAALNLHNEAERRLLLELVEKLVCSITLSDLQIESTHLQAVVEQALGSLSEQDQVLEVRVSEQDLASLRDYQAGRSWKLVADPNLGSGDCIVESRRALLDYSVQHRIDEALAALHAQLGRVPQ